MKWPQGSWWIRNVLVAATLMATGCAAIYLKWNGNHLSWLWPPPGVALAALLLLGRGAMPGLFVGAALGAAVTGLTFPLPLVVATCFCAAFYFSVYLLGRFRDFDRRLTRLRDVLLFLLIGCSLAPLMLAGFGTLAALGSHRIQLAVLWPLFRNWWLGDGLGAMVFGGLALAWSAGYRLPRGGLKRLEMLALAAGVGLLCKGIFLAPLAPKEYGVLWGYALFPFVIWSAIRFGLAPTTLLNLAIAIAAVHASTHGLGPFSAAPMQSRLWLTQAYIAILSITGMLLSVILRELAEARMQAKRDADELRLVFETAREGICIRDRDGRLLNTNTAACEMLGYTVEELIDTSGLQLVVPEQREALLETRELLRQGILSQSRWQLLHKNGSIVHVDASFVPLPDGRMQSVVRDVSPQVQAEEALRENEEKYRLIVETANDLIFTIDTDGRMTFVNRSAVHKMFGYEPEEVLGRPFLDFCDPEWAEAEMGAFQRVIGGEALVGHEGRYVRKDDRRIDLNINVIALRDGAGQLLGVTGTAVDVTALRTAEAALHESRERFAQIAGYSSDMITYHERGSHISYASPACKDLLGYSPSELQGQCAYDLVHAGDVDRMKEAFRASIHGAGRVVIESRLRRKDGEYVWVESTGASVQDPKNRELGQFIVSTRDISVRKQGEALRSAQERVLESIARAEPLQSVLDQLALSTEAQAQGSVCTITLADETRRFIQLAAAPSLPAAAAAALERLPIGTGEASCGTAAFRGQRVVVEDIGIDPLWDKYREVALGLGIHACWSQPILDEGSAVAGTLALSFTRPSRPSPADLKLLESAAHLAEVAVARHRAVEEQQKLTALVHNSGDFVAVASLDSRCLFVNEAGRRLVGLDGAVDVRTLGTPDFHPPDAPAGYHPDIRERLKTAGHWEGESQLRHFVTGQAIDVHSSLFVIREPRTGEPAFYAIVARDIRERRRLEEQLLHSQKMESVGRLAGGVAHDFNNLLTAINGYAALAQMKLGLDDPVAGDLDQIQRAGERAAHLTAQLLAFARKQIVEMKVVDLNDLTYHTEKMLRRVIGADVELATRLATGVCPIYAGTGQVEQILLNLAVNARDAMPQGGILTIETRPCQVEAGDGGWRADLAPGEYAMLSVSDTGSGMSEDVIAHIFEPFFTTKELGKGTGLGLATCYGIVKQSHGHLWVESELGKGSTFRIVWPRAATGLPKAVVSVGENVGLPRGSETVLLVEDDPQVRALAHKVLVDQGYQVVEAADGQEALRIAQAHPEFELLVTDLVMPLVGGRELAGRLRGERPELKVLFISGYSETTPSDAESVGPSGGLLQKPFTPAALSRRVRELLDRVTVTG